MLSPDGGRRLPGGGRANRLRRYGGGLSHIRLDDLLGKVLVAACERAGIERGQVDEIEAGCVPGAREEE